jgi:Rap1a immunity proteins
LSDGIATKGKALLMAAAVTTFAAPALADFQDGNSLYNLCTGQDVAECVGYVEAISDALSLETSRGENLYGWTACIAPVATGLQVKDIVVKYLAFHPETRHCGAASLVSAALGAAFPCRPTTKG